MLRRISSSNNSRPLASLIVILAYFGRGLGVGADQKHLEQNLGPDGCEACKQLT
jgi:hypothetical protein